jgi:hypothetical protein
MSPRKMLVGATALGVPGSLASVWLWHTSAAQDEIPVAEWPSRFVEWASELVRGRCGDSPIDRALAIKPNDDPVRCPRR